MPHYVVKKNDDDSKLAIIFVKGYVPEDAILLPDDMQEEDAEWLQLELVGSEEIVTVDQSEKDKVKQRRFDDEHAEPISLHPL